MGALGFQLAVFVDVIPTAAAGRKGVVGSLEIRTVFFCWEGEPSERVGSANTCTGRGEEETLRGMILRS